MYPTLPFLGDVSTWSICVAIALFISVIGTAYDVTEHYTDAKLKKKHKHIIIELFLLSVLIAVYTGHALWCIEHWNQAIDLSEFLLVDLHSLSPATTCIIGVLLFILFTSLVGFEPLHIMDNCCIPILYGASVFAFGAVLNGDNFIPSLPAPWTITSLDTPHLELRYALSHGMHTLLPLPAFYCIAIMTFTLSLNFIREYNPLPKGKLAALALLGIAPILWIVRVASIYTVPKTNILTPVALAILALFLLVRKSLEEKKS